jgi:hypothetical protein
VALKERKPSKACNFETTKERNRDYPGNVGIGNDFLKRTPKVQQLKENIDN